MQISSGVATYTSLEEPLRCQASLLTLGSRLALRSKKLEKT
jgi:hypothetical protein